MVLSPKGGLGRVLFGLIIITTISYLTVNLVSFGGNRWITYVDVPVRFGLWRVCDTTASGLCNSWVNQFASNITNFTFNDDKPGFIRASQGLEIVSLIFYVVAAGFILVGILDLVQFPYEAAFLIAAGLLFICIVFISATLGLMSVQGRNNHPLAFLDWAWWNGLAGLIITIICFISLISLVAYLHISSSSISRSSSKPPRGFARGNLLNRSPYPPIGRVGNLPPASPPILPPVSPTILPTNNTYSLPKQYFPPDYSNQFSPNPMMPYGGQSPLMSRAEPNPMMAYGGQSPSMPRFEQNPMMAYGGQTPSIPRFEQNPMMAYGGQSPSTPRFEQNPMMAYGGQSPSMPRFEQNPMMAYGGQNPPMPFAAPYPYEPHYNDQSPSPMITELARQYIIRVSDAQYQRQLLEPYRQYLRDPYLVNNYL